MKTEYFNEEGEFVLRAYTRKELRGLYGVPERTFLKWLKPYSKEWQLDRSRYLTITQVTLIIDKFGIPGMVRKF